MSIIRGLLALYRKFQYKLFNRCETGSLLAGQLCSHTPFEEEINHGDVVHPCVRYIPQGYLGHKWWMVYTPYYAANDRTENPILCYSDSDDSCPPTHWKVAYQVQEQPMKGYNSDPTLFYDNEKMYVMWRENLTDRCDKFGFVRATFGAEIFKSGIGEVFGPLVGTRDFEDDAEVSPTFIKMKDGKYRCYAMHLRFHSPFIQKSIPLVKKILESAVKVLDILGIWSQQKGFGYAIWESDDVTQSFTYLKTFKFTNCNKLYRPWHMDIFEFENQLFSIVQTNQCNADICLAKCNDDIHFRMYDKPLMTNKTCQKVGLYKSTGLVFNNNLVLYYTAQDINNRSLNKLYMTKIVFPSKLM